jgi:hypothetical protein
MEKRFSEQLEILGEVVIRYEIVGLLGLVYNK